jgi:hypothetical protein
MVTGLLSSVKGSHFDRSETSAAMVALLEAEPVLVAWWATPVECQSAVYRRQREGGVLRAIVEQALQRLRGLVEDADFVASLRLWLSPGLPLGFDPEVLTHLFRRDASLLAVRAPGALHDGKELWIHAEGQALPVRAFGYGRHRRHGLASDSDHYTFLACPARVLGQGGRPP